MTTDDKLLPCPCGHAPTRDNLEPDWCGCMNPHCEYFEVFYRIEKWNTRSEAATEREKIEECAREIFLETLPNGGRSKPYPQDRIERILTKHFGPTIG